ncbi:MAG: motility associated factor glycosyltransferase family protein [Campylobacterales bacterium]
MNDFLQINLDALITIDPLLTAKLMGVKENKRFEVYMDETDPANINIIDNELHKPLYKTRPIDETQEKLKKYLTEYSGYPYLYFFGIGNGIFYKILLSNELHKRVVCVEPSIETLFIALHFVDFSEEIKEKRFVPILFNDFSFITASSLFKKKELLVYSKLYNLDVLTSYYEEEYRDEILKINQHSIRAIKDTITAVGNDSIDSLMGIENHLVNLPKMIKSPPLVQLKEKSQKRDTAIIVSTGPSLSKQLPLLKEIEPYATIISVDASLPVLCEYGIKPDIVVSLERIPLTAEFYKKTKPECQEGVIVELSSVCHPEIVDSVADGAIKSFSMRPFGYTQYFELKDWGYMGIGMSAANMAFELVVHSRYQNCVFIGQDLAYAEDGSTHTQGHIIDESKTSLGRNKEFLYLPAYGGNGVVKSYYIWQMFLNQFERDIAQNPYRLNVINATEGGARIEGTKEIPFKEVCETIIDRSKPKEPIVLEYPSDKEVAKNLEDAKKKVHGILEYTYNIKSQIEDAFLEVAKMTEHFEEMNEGQKLEEIDFDEVGELIDKIQDVKELFTDKEFASLYNDTVQSYIVHQELEMAKIQVQYTADDDMLKKVKMVDWIYAHRYWLFSLAGGISANLEVVKRASKEWADIDEIVEKYESEDEENSDKTTEV